MNSDSRATEWTRREALRMLGSVRDRVRQRVRIGMAVAATLRGNVHSPEHQRPALNQAVSIMSNANAKHYLKEGKFLIFEL